MERPGGDVAVRLSAGIPIGVAFGLALSACASLQPRDVRRADVATLRAYLVSERSWVREEAAHELGERRAKDAVAELETLLLDDGERPYVRAAAAESLGRIADSASLPVLAGVSAKRVLPPSVSLAVIAALCRFADRSAAIQALAHFETSADPLVQAAAESQVRTRCGP